MRVGNVEQSVIEILGENGMLTAERIKLHLKDFNLNVTRQAVFDALRKLRKRAIIVKVGREYSLSAPWLFEEANRIERYISLHTGANYLARLLELSKGDLLWSFDSLLRLKLFWSNLVLAAAKLSSSRTIYSWNPHPWFYLALANHEAGVITAIRKLKKRMFKFVGGDTYLDRVAERCWQSDVVSAFFGTNPLRLSETKYMTLIPPYILTATISRKHAGKLAKMYRDVSSQREFNQVDFLEILKTKGQAKLRLEIDPVKAEKLMREFKEYS